LGLKVISRTLNDFIVSQKYSIIMYKVNYNSRTSYVSNVVLRPEGLLSDAERDLLAMAECLVPAPSMLAGGGIMFSGCPSVRPSVRSFVCTKFRLILKTSELVLMPVGTSGRRDNGTKRSTLRPGSRRSRSHEAEDRYGGLTEASVSTPLG